MSCIIDHWIELTDERQTNWRRKKNEEEKFSGKNKTKTNSTCEFFFVFVFLIEVVSFCHLTNVNVYQTQDNHLTIIIFDDNDV